MPRLFATNKPFAALFASLLLSSPIASAEEDPFRELTKGQPKDVAAVAVRIAQCNHFAGEEAYDAERRKELDAAFRKYRCERLEKDEAALRKRYKDSPSVGAALQKAHEW